MSAAEKYLTPILIIAGFGLLYFAGIALGDGRAASPSDLSSASCQHCITIAGDE